jgi:hypothetical protein
VRLPVIRSGLWRGATIVAVAGLVVGVGLLDATQVRLIHRVPRTKELFAKLPGHPADPPDPPFGVPIDVAAIREAANMIPVGATYQATFENRPGLGYNVNAATALYLADALRVKRLSDAEWVISYEARPPIPAGLNPLVALRVGPHVLLIKTRHR